MPSDQHAADLLACAQDLGINLIDTAPAYGLAEERLGGLLTGQRHQWVLGSKVGEQFDGQSHFDFTHAGAVASLQQSLTRLRTDYLDYWLLHSDGNDLAVLESGACHAVMEAKVRGDVRATGISSKTVEGAIAALDLGLDIVMLTLNPEQLEESTAALHACTLGRGVLVKKAMGSGYLPAATALPTVAEIAGVTAIISGTLNPHHLRANAIALGHKE